MGKILLLFGFWLFIDGIASLLFCEHYWWFQLVRVIRVCVGLAIVWMALLLPT